MNAERHGLFTELTPPPGGAERFARRLDELAAAPATSHRRVEFLGAVACAALVALAAIVWQRQPDPSQTLGADPQAPVDLYGAPELDRLLGRTRQPAELTVVVGTEAATVTQLDTSNQKVRIYRID